VNRVNYPYILILFFIQLHI